MSHDTQVKQEAPERIWMQPGQALDPAECTLSHVGTERVTEQDVEYVRADLVSAPIVAPVVDRSLYSELIHIAAELARGNGFLSTCAEDMSPRLKRADILKTAERQEERLKDWAYRVRRVADKLSPAPASTVAPQQSDDWSNGATSRAADAEQQAREIVEGCSNWHDIQHKIVPRIIMALQSRPIAASAQTEQSGERHHAG